MTARDQRLLLLEAIATSVAVLLAALAGHAELGGQVRQVSTIPLPR